jgi:hypothetical protein
LAVSSGNRWASVVSIPSTWSTMICFIFPLDISMTVPRGSFGSFSNIFFRILFRMEKVALWDMDNAIL